MRMPAHQVSGRFSKLFSSNVRLRSRAPEGSSPPTRPTASVPGPPILFAEGGPKTTKRLRLQASDQFHPPRPHEATTWPSTTAVGNRDGGNRDRQSRRNRDGHALQAGIPARVWATWRSGCARNFWPRRRKPRGQSCLADRQPLWTRQRRGGLGPENAPYGDCPVARCFKHPVFAEPINVDCSFAAKTRVPRALRLTAGSGRGKYPTLFYGLFCRW